MKSNASDLLYRVIEFLIRKFAPKPQGAGVKAPSRWAFTRVNAARMDYLRELAAQRAESDKSNLWHFLMTPVQRLVASGRYSGEDEAEVRLTLQLLGSQLERAVAASFRRWCRHYGVSRWMPHDGERQRHRPIPQKKAPANVCAG